MGATGVLPCPGPCRELASRLPGMTRSARPVLLVALTTLLLAGCGPGTSVGPSASGTATPASEPPASSSGPSAAPATPEVSDAPASQTETEFGTIWDGVPDGFPRFRGGRDADDAGAGPASDVYVVPGGDAELIVGWLQAAMEDATYSTEALSGPFEDGGYELDSVGSDDCRIRTTVAPQGDMILVTVLYGAACPAA